MWAPSPRKKFRLRARFSTCCWSTLVSRWRHLPGNHTSARGVYASRLAGPSPWRTAVTRTSGPSRRPRPFSEVSAHTNPPPRILQIYLALRTKTSAVRLLFLLRVFVSWDRPAEARSTRPSRARLVHRPPIVPDTFDYPRTPIPGGGSRQRRMSLDDDDEPTANAPGRSNAGLTMSPVRPPTTGSGLQDGGRRKLSTACPTSSTWITLGAATPCASA